METVLCLGKLKLMSVYIIKITFLNIKWLELQIIYDYIFLKIK